MRRILSLLALVLLTSLSLAGCRDRESEMKKDSMDPASLKALENPPPGMPGAPPANPTKTPPGAPPGAPTQGGQ